MAPSTHARDVVAVVASPCNPSTWEMEEGRSGGLAHSALHGELEASLGYWATEDPATKQNNFLSIWQSSGPTHPFPSLSSSVSLTGGQWKSATIKEYTL